MGIPNETLTVVQGLGAGPATAGKTSVSLGICSGGIVGQLYGFADPAAMQTTLGQGPLVEAMADKLTVAGGLQYALPLNPTTAGTVSSTNTSLVTGAATVVGSAAPAQSIAIKIILGGAIGTFTFAVSINGGPFGAPVVTTGTPFPYLVPGTLTKITFAAGTYVLGDVYTISTLGAITLVGSGPSTSNLTFSASPLDGYDVRVKIVGAGLPGTGLFTYSVDGNNNVSTQILIPSGGAYAIPNTGVVLTFSGTFVALDVYSMTTSTASFSASDVATAMAAFLLTRTRVFALHVIGQAANAAGAATLAGAVDSQMTAAETAQFYEFAIIECPTTETDSVLNAAFATFFSRRVMVCAGDIGHQSSANPGRIIRRNCSTVVATRLCATKPSEHPGFQGSAVKGGPDLSNVQSIYPNGGQASWTPDVLDANRFTTLRLQPDIGYFVTRGRIMSPAGDDYDNVMNRRVMDVASRTAIFALSPFLNKDLKVNPQGTIDEREATAIEGIVRAQIETAIVNTPDGGDASSVIVTISRTEKILTTKTMPVTIKIVPKGYAENIPILIGLINPAIAA